jgi:ubiquinone/menaquinone biosynthesis C-methylase UbiE
MGLADEPDTNSARLKRLLAGKWVVQALAVAAELRLADILSEPLTLEELANRAECQPEPLLRLLRVLVGEGLLEQLADSRYELTELGAELKTGALGELAQFVGSPSQWLPWTKLSHALRTGACAFEASMGSGLFDYLVAHPEEARLYDTAVDAFTRLQAEELANHAVMATARTVVDVGGGRGTLLIELLQRRPQLSGILVDRPDVVATAKQRFEAAGLGGRYQLCGTDFFESLPQGADCYVIKHVVHNWSDEDVVRLLRACMRVMAPGARLLIVEALLLPGNRRDIARYMDLEMLVLTGAGKERSKPEFRQLLSRAGLRLASTHSLGLGAWLLVAQSGGGVAG